MNEVRFSGRMIGIFSVIMVTLLSCKTNSGSKPLKFKDYPYLKIGFTTQNFQKAMPLSVENIYELIGFASDEGYQFIELRDDMAGLTTAECNEIQKVAGNRNIGVIYEIQKNPLDTGYFRIFSKALENAAVFDDPGILRVMISRSEFASDTEKKGWSIEELNRLIKIVDSCAALAESRNLRLLIENSDEAFFGNDSIYFGISDFFANTALTGFQFDISNPFRQSARVQAEPEKVMEFMALLGSRWVASHIKTIQVMGGVMQPVLTENPLPVEDVINLMGEMGAPYVALELLAVEDKEECINNHRASINFLKEKGLLE